MRKSLTGWLFLLSPCLLFGKQDQGIICFLFQEKKSHREGGENMIPLFFLLTLCVKWN